MSVTISSEQGTLATSTDKQSLLNVRTVVWNVEEIDYFLNEHYSYLSIFEPLMHNYSAGPRDFNLYSDAYKLQGLRSNDTLDSFPSTVAFANCIHELPTFITTTRAVTRRGFSTIDLIPYSGLFRIVCLGTRLYSFGPC